MKKLVIVIFAAIAIIGLCLPPVFGIVTENRVTERLVHGEANPYITAKISAYERGLYSSTATLTLRPTDEYLATLAESVNSADPATPEEAKRQEVVREFIAASSGGFSLDLHFRHGPLSIQDGPFFGLSYVTASVESHIPYLTDLQERLGLAYLMKIHAELEFDGSATFQGNIPPFSVSEKDASTEFSGLDIDGRIDATDRSIIAQAGIDLIARNSDAMSLSVEGISMNMDMTMLTSYFMFGDSNFLVRSVSAAIGNDVKTPVFKIENFALETTMNLDEMGDRAAIDLTYRLGLLTSADDTRIEDAQLNVGLSGISVRAMEEYAKLVQTAGIIDEQTMAQSMPELMKIMHDILAGSPSLTINPIAFKYNGEAFNATLKLAIDGSKLPPLTEFENAEQLMWAKMVSGNARIDATEHLANSITEIIARGQIQSGMRPESNVSEEQIQAMVQQQSQVMLTNLIQQGMLKRDAGNITALIDYTNNQLSVNDIVIPFNPTARQQMP